jgi:hypothetical protein
MLIIVNVEEHYFNNDVLRVIVWTSLDSVNHFNYSVHSWHRLLKIRF